MSPSELATVILVLCSAGETDKHFECYDYYNNCVVDKGMNLDAVDKCQKNYDEGVKRIIKLRDEK